MIEKTEKLDPRCGIYEIGPEWGRALLDGAQKKRPVRAGAVERYYRRMKDGHWRLSGQPIILSASGELLDGQHRLEAVCRLGRAMRFVVLFGDFEWKTMDEGRPRDGADLLYVGMGAKWRYQMQAAIRLVLAHNHSIDKESSFESAAFGGNRVDIDNAEFLSFAKRNPELYEICEAAGALRSELVPLSPSLAAWFLIARKHGRPTADAWFRPLMTGAELKQDDVRLALRRRLANDARNGTRPPARGVFLLICKAWAQKDQAVKVLSVKSGEVVPLIR